MESQGLKGSEEVVQQSLWEWKRENSPEPHGRPARPGWDGDQERV